MKYYNKNTDFSSKNSSENNEKYGNANTTNVKPLKKYNNYRIINKNNSKEDITQIKNDDKNKQYGEGKFRFINTKAEKEKKIFKKRNINDYDILNYTTHNTNDKINKNNSNKITNNTNNISIIKHIPKEKNSKNNFDYSNYENLKKEENITPVSNRKNNSYDFRIYKKHRKTPIRYSEDIDYYRRNPYLETEPNKRNKKRKLYKAILSDVSKKRYNKSFNKSIEEKRILLGIPVYKTEFQKYNTNISTKDDIFNQENKNNHKVIIYKKRQDEIVGNFEKKNILNKRIREYIKSHSQKKNPIRIIYDDININNIFENDSGLNTSIFKNSYLTNHNHNRRNYISQDNKPNKTHDIFGFKDEDRIKIYLKNKIQFYRQKEKANKMKKLKTNTNPRTVKEIFRFKNSPINKIKTPEEKKIYDNNSYYSNILPKMNNSKEKESQKNNSIKPSYTNIDNKNMNNLSNTTKYKKRNINLNIIL